MPKHSYFRYWLVSLCHCAKYHALIVFSSGKYGVEFFNLFMYKTSHLEIGFLELALAQYVVASRLVVGSLPVRLQRRQNDKSVGTLVIKQVQKCSYGKSYIS